jgi:hypothetical protein
VTKIPQHAENQNNNPGRWVAALIWGEQPATSLAARTSLGGYPLRSFPGKPGLPLSGLLKPWTRVPSSALFALLLSCHIVLSQKLLKSVELTLNVSASGYPIG